MRLSFLLAAAMLTTAAAIAQQQQWANDDPYYARRVTHFATLPPITRGDIVFLGNSLTDGAEWNELLGNRHVKNRGIVGDIIQGLIDRLDPILDGQPKKLFILSGVNDVSHDVDGDSIGRVMEKLIVTVKRRCPKTKIYLQSMLPINNDFGRYRRLIGKEQVVLDGNRALEAVARRQGVTWINLFPLFANDEGKLRPDLTNDGLHLLGNGYLIWRDALKPYLK